MYTREKHPVNDLTNADVVKEIFYDLEDTGVFKIEIIHDQARNDVMDRKMVCYYELERSKIDMFPDDNDFMGYNRVEAIEHRCEIDTNPKIAIIQIKKDPNSHYTKSDEVMILERSEILLETMDRVKDYLGDDLYNIDKSWKSNAYTYIPNTMILIQFTSYEVREIL